MINKILGQLNERHGYPKSWTINVPLKPIIDPTKSTALGSFGVAVLNAVFNRGGVKVKVGFFIPNESDGRTSFGQVMIVRKVGFGSCVIVNRGTEKNPFCEIYPGAEFGKGIAQWWLASGQYKCEDLPKKTVASQLKIFGRGAHSAAAIKIISSTLSVVSKH